MPNWPTPHSDDQLAQAKEGLLESVYRQMLRAFKKLWGPTAADVQKDSMVEGISVLTEANFTKNIKHVIGVDNAFFGKLLYLYFAKGMDQAKITLAMFVEGLRPYAGEERLLQNQSSFRILDLDQDRELNILNLLHLFKNLPTNTNLGVEILKVIDFFCERNTFEKN